MLYSSNLIRGHLIQRYKRFLADVQIPSQESPVTVHCPNSGSMTGVAEAGTPVWIRHTPSPTRKLSYTWELSEIGDTLVGINTHLPNSLVYEALLNQKFPFLKNYDHIHREPKISSESRLDFKVMGEGLPPCFIEVKSVHMKWNNHAAFPDAPTKRGQKHLHELMALRRSGARTIMIYVIQRGDVSSFTLQGDIDPCYKETFQMACALGIESYAYKCIVTPESIELDQPLNLVI